MTATGVQDSFTLFDIMTIFGSSGGPYTYALWFDYGGTFSFDKDVTLSKSYFAEDFSTLGTDTKLIKAGEVVDVAAGTSFPCIPPVGFSVAAFVVCAAFA